MTSAAASLATSGPANIAPARPGGLATSLAPRPAMTQQSLAPRPAMIQQSLAPRPGPNQPVPRPDLAQTSLAPRPTSLGQRPPAPPRGAPLLSMPPGVAMEKVREVEARLAQLRATAPESPPSTRPPVPLPSAGDAPRPPSQPPVRLRRPRLGDLLTQRGIVTAEQLEQALAEQHKSGLRIGSILVELGYLKPDQLVAVLADQLGIEVIVQDQVEKVEIDPSAREVLPIDLIKRHEVVPLFATPKVLRVAMADPTNLAVIDELRFTSGRWIQVVLTPEATVRSLINTHFSSETVLTEALQAPTDGDLETLKVEGEEEETHDAYDLVHASADQPVVNFVNYLLTESVRRGASDIHIEPFENNLRVRFRIDGELLAIVSPPKRLHTPVVSRIKVMSGMDISKRRIPQDGHLAVRHHGQVLHYRVSTLPTVYGEKAVLRLLTKDAALADLNRLGLDPPDLARFRRAISFPQGLVLVTGPTGSGKTTTVHAAINAIAAPTRNVMTLEDPVEVTLPGVNHVQIREGQGVSFADGLRSILRQDPDVVFVGEMRDAEVSRIAIRASLTGHLVLSTLHTNSALECFERLDDLGIERYLIAPTIQTVVAQRLLRRVCAGCEQPVSLSQVSTEGDVAPEIITALLGVEGVTLKRGAGCDRCLKTGHKGRLGVYEVLPMDREIRELLRTRAPLSEVRAAAAARGFRTLFEHGLSLAARGLTTVQEVQRVLLSDS